MRECSKTLDDGCILALDSYSRYQETGRLLDRLLRRKVYVLKIEKKMGEIMMGISDASSSLLTKHVYPPRKFYQDIYDKIRNEQDFHNSQAKIKNFGRN